MLSSLMDRILSPRQDKSGTDQLVELLSEGFEGQVSFKPLEYSMQIKTDNNHSSLMMPSMPR